MELSGPAAPAPGLDAIVVIPARDEEERIGACLAALRNQREVSPGTWEIILVLDSCTDATAERIADAQSLPGGPALQVVAGNGLGAGGARATGMDLAAGRLEATGRLNGLIATTDADSRVAPDWLARQLEATAAGAAAIGGLILLDPAESQALATETIAKRSWEHEARLSALSADGPTQHPFFGGASIGITADAYRRVGGMKPVEALEDEALARALRAEDIVIHRLNSVRVITSARIEGRASLGLAHNLRLAESIGAGWKGQVGSDE